jgi:hypothetical protein
MGFVKIGYDAGGVVVEIVRPLARFLNSHRIAVPSYEDTFNHNLTRVWRCDAEEVSRRIALFYGSSEFATLEPVKDVVKSFARLFPPHIA